MNLKKKRKKNEIKEVLRVLLSILVQCNAQHHQQIDCQIWRHF